MVVEVAKLLDDAEDVTEDVDEVSLGPPFIHGNCLPVGGFGCNNLAFEGPFWPVELSLRGCCTGPLLGTGGLNGADGAVGRKYCCVLGASM